ncbi:hypothetical protein F4777DRAFT_69465 [Nemania sp. FL0916]|nr:hypothetical protein F4777DRAFT_69465 [Nemania sp. FL0916]
MIRYGMIADRYPTFENQHRCRAQVLRGSVSLPEGFLGSWGLGCCCVMSWVGVWHSFGPPRPGLRPGAIIVVAVIVVLSRWAWRPRRARSFSHACIHK